MEKLKFTALFEVNPTFEKEKLLPVDHRPAEMPTNRAKSQKLFIGRKVYLIKQGCYIYILF